MATSRGSIIGVTGTPGTGKKSIGRVVADMLGFKYFELNRLAFESGSVLTGNEEDFDVDPAGLRRCVLDSISGGGVVLVGHLLPYVLSKGEVDFVAVLRCAPSELEKRYAERNYSEEKMKTNVSAEILDVCLVDALKSFGVDTLSEFDTTEKTPSDVAEKVVKVYRGLSKKSVGKISWLTGRSAKRLIRRYFG